MKGLRSERLGRQVQRELGEIFLELQRDVFKGKLITVSEVRMTPDLLEARVYLSIFPSEEAQSILEEVKNLKSEIRFRLGKKLSHIRRIPDLKFFLDDTLDYLEHIDQLLKK